jgi:hypothetical protein
MTLDEIAKLVELISKTEDPTVKKLLTDYLAATLLAKNTLTEEYGLPNVRSMRYTETTEPVVNFGCRVCGIGKNGEIMGYVCPRTDCPTRITCSS